MQRYDVALKSILQAQGVSVLERLAGVRLARWMNVELPQVLAARLDMLGETDNGELVHFELQSTNDSQMPLRMAEYALGVYRQFGRFARQFVLYVEEPELRMVPELTAPNVLFRYELVDIRQIDGEEFLHSSDVDSNVLAILGRVKNLEQTARDVLARIAQLPPERRGVPLQQLVILSGLRGLDDFIRAQTQNMPVVIDLLDNAIIGPAFNDGRLSILRHQITRRFGAVPEWVEARLKVLKRDEFEPLADRVLDAQCIEDLFDPR